MTAAEYFEAHPEFTNKVGETHQFLVCFHNMDPEDIVTRFLAIGFTAIKEITHESISDIANRWLESEEPREYDDYFSDLYAQGGLEWVRAGA